MNEKRSPILTNQELGEHIAKVLKKVIRRERYNEARRNKRKEQKNV